MEDLEIESIQTEWKKVPYIERKKIYPILKNATSEEIDKIFSDDELLQKVIHTKDNNILSMVFRYGGFITQERIWQEPNNQKKLLGMGNIDDDTLLEIIKANKFYHATELEKKKKAGKFSFTKEKMRVFELFMRTIKSQTILDSLPSNPYYQMIILFSKKVPSKVIQNIDIPKLFQATTTSSLYQYATPRQKVAFCNFLNGYETSLLLPHDYLQIFSETKIFSYYDSDNKNSIGHLLRNKIFLLGREKKKLEIPNSILCSLTIREFIILIDADESVVDKEVLNDTLAEFIGNAIEDGSILSPKYLDFELLENKAYFSIFQTITTILTSKDKCNDFLSYLFQKLFQEHYTEEEKQEIYPLLKNSILNANQNTIAALFFRSTDLKSMFFIRYGISSRYMDYLNGISPIQILRLNVKPINKLTRYLEDETQDEISDIYSKAIKLYCAFGLERSVSILKEEYGKITKCFLDNVSKLIVKDIQLKQNGKRYEPISNPGFLTFLFQSGQIKHLFEEECNMSKSWYYLYNQFEELKELCHGHLTFPKVEIILKEKLNTVNYPIPPNCYPLENVIQEIGVGNKTKHPTNEVYAEAIRIYQQQLKRTTSSIPYVEGKLGNGYRYETMRLHDTVAYVLGYRASCCIRVLDIAHKHLLHALLCESGRILIIYDPDNNPAAFSPLKRNGELLIANSIEMITKENQFSNQYDFTKNSEAIQEAFMEGILAIINRSKEEEEKEFIKVATIGRNSPYKPESTQWPSSIPTPTILEKKDSIYKETDEYHRQLNIIYQDPRCSLSSLVYGKSKIHYQDPRKKVQACDFKNEEDYLNQQHALNVVNSINYECLSEEERKSFQKVHSSGIECILFGEDWYVLVTNQHLISSKCLPYDERAEKEMKATLSLTQEAITTKSVKQLILTMQKKED